MCKTTRAIERHPETQRKALEIVRACKEIYKDIRRILEAEEGHDGPTERHA